MRLMRTDMSGKLLHNQSALGMPAQTHFFIFLFLTVNLFLYYFKTAQWFISGHGRGIVRVTCYQSLTSKRFCYRNMAGFFYLIFFLCNSGREGTAVRESYRGILSHHGPIGKY